MMKMMKRSENTPDVPSPLPPTEHEAKEQSFGVAVRRAVDDLFTYQPIAEALAGTEGDDEVEHFVGVWKQGLAEFLAGTGEMAVEEFIKDFERFQSERSTVSAADTRQDVIPRIEGNGSEK